MTSQMIDQCVSIFELATAILTNQLLLFWKSTKINHFQVHKRVTKKLTSDQSAVGREEWNLCSLIYCTLRFPEVDQMYKVYVRKNVIDDLLCGLIMLRPQSTHTTRDEHTFLSPLLFLTQYRGWTHLSSLSVVSFSWPVWSFPCPREGLPFLSSLQWKMQRWSPPQWTPHG